MKNLCHAYRCAIWIVLILSALTFGKAQVNSDQSLPWVASVGVGVSSGEFMPTGLSRGAYVGYEYKRILKVGAGFVHSSSQLLHKPYLFGYGAADKMGSLVQITREENAGRDRDYLADYSAVQLILGFNPLGFIVKNRHHDCTISVLGGLGHFRRISAEVNQEGNFISFANKGPWAVGARLSYEYRFNDRIGVGVSGTYEIMLEHFYTLANLAVHF